VFHNYGKPFNEKKFKEKKHFCIPLRSEEEETGEEYSQNSARKEKQLRMKKWEEKKECSKLGYLLEIIMTMLNLFLKSGSVVPWICWKSYHYALW
jgi:hypothetical protein